LGPSTIMIEPPSPVILASTDVISRSPRWSFKKRPLVFWSYVSLKRPPQYFWYHGLSIRRRHLTLSRIASEEP